jgi:hypothetical protein
MWLTIFVCESEMMMTRGGGGKVVAGRNTCICARVGGQGEGLGAIPSLYFTTHT